MKMFQQHDNGFLPTTMFARDQTLYQQSQSVQMTSSGGSNSVIGPNSVPSSSNSSSASGVYPSSMLVQHLPMVGQSMMPYMRPMFHAPMAYDGGAPHYFIPVPVPMDSGRLSEYINPLMTHRIQQAQFAHQYPQGRATSSYKTVMCQSWLETAKCTFGELCKFAHGESEIRFARPPIKNPKKYRTRLCEKYTMRGCCPYGNRCLFIHPDPAEMLAVTPPAGVDMSLDTYKNYVVVPQPSLMLVPPASPFLPDEMSIESSQFRYRVVEALSEKIKKVCVVNDPSEETPLPSSPHLSVRSANGALSTKEDSDSVEEVMVVGEEEKQPKDCKQVLHDMLRREDKQRKTIATDPTTIPTTDDEKPEEESTGVSSSKKSQKQQQNVSFNESGQRESLAYTLANVLDSSP